MDLDRITAQAYRDFHDNNKDLLKKNPVVYWQQATVYKERVIHDYVAKKASEDKLG